MIKIKKLPKKLPKEIFDEIYRQVPRLCVEVIINTPNGIVLTKRLIPPCIGMWHFPGGTVFMGEKLEEAVNRVADEELGINLEKEKKKKKMIGIIEYSELFNSVIGIAFLCELKEQKGREKEEQKGREKEGEQRFRGSFQAEEIKTFHIDEIPENMIPEQKEFLEKLVVKLKER